MQDPLIGLQAQFRELAKLVVEATNAEREASGWTQVILDTRSPAHRKFQFTKMRAKVGDALVSVSALYGDIAPRIGKIFESDLGEPFFGITLSINAEGEVEIRLNYDPNCPTDPAFVAW